MSTRTPTIMALAVVAALSLLPAAPAWAGPTDQLREYTDQVIKILDDPALARGDRRAAVRKIAHEAFDVNETARRVLARHWQARTPAERDEFAQLFADLLERTYIARLDEYGGERIRYVGESIDGELAAVRARIVTRAGIEVPVESRMVRRGERWLWWTLLLAGLAGYGAALGVHYAVGYHSPFHLAPAFAGLALFGTAMALSYPYLTAVDDYAATRSRWSRAPSAKQA